jgi:hypothetical protein
MRSSDSPSDADSKKSSKHPWMYCLEAYINWSNRLSSFVTTEIIKHLKRHIRVKLLNYFIDAALECFNTGNFNSMMGILGKVTRVGFSRSTVLKTRVSLTFACTYKEQTSLRKRIVVQLDPFVLCEQRE